MIVKLSFIPGDEYIALNNENYSTYIKTIFAWYIVALFIMYFVLKKSVSITVFLSTYTNLET